MAEYLRNELIPGLTGARGHLTRFFGRTNTPYADSTGFTPPAMALNMAAAGSTGGTTGVSAASARREQSDTVATGEVFLVGTVNTTNGFATGPSCQVQSFGARYDSALSGYAKRAYTPASGGIEHNDGAFTTYTDNEAAVLTNRGWLEGQLGDGALAPFSPVVSGGDAAGLTTWTNIGAVRVWNRGSTSGLGPEWAVSSIQASCAEFNGVYGNENGAFYYELAVAHGTSPADTPRRIFCGWGTRLQGGLAIFNMSMPLPIAPIPCQRAGANLHFYMRAQNVSSNTTLLPINFRLGIVPC